MSTNYGTNWTAVNNGLTNKYVYALTVIDSTLFAGTMVGVFKSVDNGANWVNTGGAHTRSFTSNDSIIFAGTIMTSVYKSGLPPYRPSNPTANSISSSQINLSWTAGPGTIQKYRIYRSLSSGSGFTQIDSVTAPTVTYNNTTGLSPATTYYYRIYAVNTIGPSNSSNEVSATTLAAEPTAQPGNITITNYAVDSMRVSYTAAAGSPTGYIAIRSAGTAPAANPADGTTYSSGQIINGTDTVAYVGSSLTFGNTGLAANTVYYYKIYSYNGTGAATNYLLTSPLSGSRTTLQSEPANQPTNLAFTNVSGNSMTISYTAAAGSPSGYLAVRRKNSAPAGIPADGVSYTAGQVIGTDSVVYTGSAVTFNQTGLNDSAAYHYKIYFYNGFGEARNYNTVNPLYGYKMTLRAEPTAQPANLTFSNIQSNSFTVNFTVASPSPNGYICIRRVSAAPTTVPADGVTYTVGQGIGSDTVVFKGSINNFSQSNLSMATEYYYKIYSFNGSDSLINYLTTGPLSGSCFTYQTEPTAQPMNLIFSNVASNSMTLSFTAAAGSPTGYLTIRRAGSAPVAVPSDGTAYVKGQAIGSDSVAQVGSATTFNETSLQSGIDYYYKIFSYNGTSGATNYLTASALSGHQATLVVEPTAPPTNPVFTNVQANSLTLSFTPAAGNPAGYLVIRKSGSAPSGVPVDGTVYTAGQTIGTDSVVYSGGVNSFDQIGLAPTTRYYYKIFSYNGTGTAINYLTTSPLNCNRSTLYTQPSAQPTNLQFSNVQSNSMTITYSPSAGGATGYIVLRKAGSSVTGIPTDGINYQVSQVVGVDSVVYKGSLTSVNLLGLNASTEYFYAVFAYNGSDTLVNYMNTSPPLTSSIYTFTAEPTHQPTEPIFTDVQAASLTLSFTPAVGNPSGYLVLRKSGSAPTNIPVDGIWYSTGQTLGSDSVVYCGGLNSFDQTGLFPMTLYYYRIYSYNGSGGSVNYLTTGPLTCSRSTLYSQPANQPTNIQFSNVQTNGMTVSYSPASGGATGYLILRNALSPTTGVPSDGINYIVGQTVGVDSVVYKGNLTSVSMPGLYTNTEYFYSVFSYNGADTLINYINNQPPLSGSRSTLQVEPTAPATNLQFTNVQAGSMEITFTPAAGNPDGYLILRRTGSSPTALPADGISFTAGQIIGTDSIVYSGSAPGFTQYGLTAGTQYFYRIYSFNGTGGSVNYLTSQWLEGDRTTLVNEPAHQPTNLQFQSIQANSISLSFTASSGGAQGYIVLRNSGIPPDNKPIDGIAYTKGQTIGIDSIVYIGNSTSFEDMGLSSNTQYYYSVFSYNGTGTIINYNIISSLTGTNHTLHPEPVAQPTNMEFQNVMSNSMTVTFTAATANPDGYIAIMRNGLSPTSSPVDRRSYSVGEKIGLDSVVFLGNSTSTSFELTGLVSDVRYYFKIYSFNGNDTTTNYYTVSPLLGDATTLLDIQAPTFDSVVISQPRFLNNDVTLNAYVRDNMSVKQVLLEYRKGIDTSFTHSIVMDFKGGYRYEKTIPAADVNLSGIVYRITAKDNSNNQRVSSGSFMISVQANVITTAIENSRYPSGFPSAEKGQGDKYWFLFSIPLTLPSDSNRASQVLRSLGTFNQDWKLYDGNGNPAPNAPFTPGKAYWLKQITGAAIPISLGSGSIEPAESFTITLPPKQWHLIGTPYPVACTWEDNDSLQGPIRYTGTNYEGEGQFASTPVQELKPFEGYWVRSLKSTDMNMIIRPKSSGLLFMKKSGTNAAGWMAQFTVKSEDLCDLYNFIGAKHDASLSVDRYDMPELPRMGDYINISFLSNDDDGYVNKNTIDIVPTDISGHTWDMIFESNLQEAKADLHWNAISFPTDYIISIIDVTNNQSINSNDKSYTFKRRMDGYPVKFKVLIGTKEYIEGEIDKIRSEIPQEFTLYPNFPNPFNPQTTIRYDLAKTGKVELKIYNVLGQEVRTLITNQIQETGKYQIIWDGRDNSGKMASSGMYILYRLRTIDFVKSRKMLLIK